MEKKLRQIITIDEDKCDGCGLCVTACAEGALAIVDGKAKLVSENFCDGLGACLGECPRGAICIEERVSESFDEQAAKKHVEAGRKAATALPCGCPSTTVVQFNETHEPEPCQVALKSELAHWPVQLTLVPPTAPFLQGADLLLAADCAPFVYPAFHRDFMSRHAVLVACPKLDDYESHLSKLTRVLEEASVKSITVARVEVGCCRGLVSMAEQAVTASGKDIPLTEVVLGVRGEVKARNVIKIRTTTR